MKGNIFIKRPVMAMSIAIIILLLGGISYFNLPIEQFPNIAPPTVVVAATYPGASAEAVTKAVIQPLEETINGVENMIYMTSTSTNSGSATITVYFKQGTNPDMAAVNVQNRVSMAQGLLPQEVTMIGVTTFKRQTSFLQINALVSDVPEYDQNFMANYMNINVTPQLKRIQGVGEVFALGANYALRVWLKPEIMAQHNLIPSDITGCLAEQNLEAAAGKLGEKPIEGGHGKNVDNLYEYVMKYTGRLKTVEEFENIVIQANPNGNILRLKDVADIELGQVDYGYSGMVNGKPSVQFMAFQLAGANAKDTNDRFSAKLKEMEKDLPKGMHFQQMMSSNDFLLESIANVEETLIIAIFLVILVVYFFLQDFKATLIPAISIIISLVGTFAALQIAGFTLNLLTLFALVLAIGTVVDDAIVVVEAVQAKFDAGYKSSYQATKDAMGDVTMAVISCTFVFMAVFIPVTMMGGTSGMFYTQFGITLATAVGISCVSALVVCPALCAMMMRPSDGSKSEKSINGRVKKAYQASFGAVMGKYTKNLRRVVKHRWVAWGSVIAAFILLYFSMTSLPKGLVPQEDQGVLMVNVTCAPGSNLGVTEKVLDKVQDIVAKDSDIADFSRVSGYGMMSGQGAANAMVILRLKNWDERSGNWIPGSGYIHTSTIKKYMLMSQFSREIPEAKIFVFEPGMIPGYGLGSNVDLHLQDRSDGDKGEFLELTNQFLGALNQRDEVQMAMTSYARNFPQLQVEVDAAQCKRAGISPATVLSTLGSYCGGSYVSNFNQYGKVYRVMLQTDPKNRTSEADLSNMYVRSGASMAPLSQFVKLKPVLGPENDTRFNLFSEITIMASPAPGYMSTDVMRAIEEVRQQVLPDHITYEYGSISREEHQQMGSNQTILIYAICVILIFLILSCLYESFFVPFSVILSVPAGLMGSFAFAWIWNKVYTVFPPIGQIENNIYLQTGVIMLIGLLAKTAILITEFALERRRKGMGIVEAAYAAAEARLRPILMTVLTAVLGMMPLLFSTGAGANGNRTIGVGVVGGMIVGTIAILFTVPVFFIFFEYIQEKVRPAMKEEADQQFIMERERSQREKAKANEDNDEYQSIMKTTRIFIALCATAVLSSCGIYKNYERPATIDAEGIYGNVQNGGEQGLGDLQWRQVFTDPALQALIEKVLAQNSSMRQADLRIQEAQNNLKAAKLAFFPSLAFAPSGTISGIVDPYDRDEYKQVMGNGANKTYSFPLSLNWQLDCFATLRNTKKSREVAVENMKSVRQAVQTALVANVANMYYTLAMLDRQHAIAEETTEKWSKTLEMTRHLMEAGMANKAAVASTEANYWAIRTSTLDLELSIRQVENALCTLLGETPHVISRSSLDSFRVPAACETGFPIGLLSRRPDVKQAELALASAFYNKNIAKAAFYPAINITANGQYANSISGAGIVNPGGLIMAAVASLTQPIFQNGRIRAAYKNSQAEMEVATIGFQQTLLEAGSEVNNAMADLNTDRAKKELLEQQVRSYAEAVDANEKLYRESSNNYLNVLTAQSGLLNAQMSQTTNAFNIVSDVISLYQALGGGAE